MTLASLWAGISTDCSGGSSGRAGGDAPAIRPGGCAATTAHRNSEPRQRRARWPTKNSVVTAWPSQPSVMNTGRPDHARERSWRDRRHRLIARQARRAPTPARTHSPWPAAHRSASGSAATVCDRSPPESCSRMTCPCTSGFGSLTCSITRLDDLVGGRALPVVGIDMQSDREIAHGLGDLDRHDLIGCGRLGVAEIGRPEQSHRAAGQRLEQPLGGVDLERDERVRAARRDWDG